MAFLGLSLTALCPLFLSVILVLASLFILLTAAGTAIESEKSRTLLLILSTIVVWIATIVAVVLSVAGLRISINAGTLRIGLYLVAFSLGALSALGVITLTFCNTENWKFENRVGLDRIKRFRIKHLLLLTTLAAVAAAVPGSIIQHNSRDKVEYNIVRGPNIPSVDGKTIQVDQLYTSRVWEGGAVEPQPCLVMDYSKYKNIDFYRLRLQDDGKYTTYNCIIRLPNGTDYHTVLFGSEARVEKLIMEMQLPTVEAHPSVPIDPVEVKEARQDEHD